MRDVELDYFQYEILFVVEEGAYEGKRVQCGICSFDAE